MEAKAIAEEVHHQLARLEKQAIVDIKAELVQNIYPLLQLMAEQSAALTERLDLAEDAIAEALASTESVILPELAGRMSYCLELGLRLCKPQSDIERAASAAEYQKLAKELLDEIASVTLDAGDEDEDDDEQPTADEADEGEEQ